MLSPRRLVRLILVLIYALKAFIRGRSRLSPLAYANRRTVLVGRNRVHAEADVRNSVVGFASYIGRFSRLPDTVIGAYCSIAEKVELLEYTHPTRAYVSTHPAFFSLAGQAEISFGTRQKFNEKRTLSESSEMSLCVGNDVWIGKNVLIIGGVRIGDGAVIAAGSVVTKDIPQYAIVAGVPAKLVRYRFSQSQIEWLCAFKWWNRSEEWIREHAEKFDDIDEFMAEFSAKAKSVGSL